MSGNKTLLSIAENGVFGFTHEVIHEVFPDLKASKREAVYRFFNKYINSHKDRRHLRCIVESLTNGCGVEAFCDMLTDRGNLRFSLGDNSSKYIFSNNTSFYYQSEFSRKQKFLIWRPGGYASNKRGAIPLIPQINVGLRNQKKEYPAKSSRALILPLDKWSAPEESRIATVIVYPDCITCSFCQNGNTFLNVSRFFISDVRSVTEQCKTNRKASARLELGMSDRSRITEDENLNEIRAIMNSIVRA